MKRKLSLRLPLLLSGALVMSWPPATQSQTQSPDGQYRGDLEKQILDERLQLLTHGPNPRRQHDLSTNLIAMIDGRLGDLDTFGAGIIFGRDWDRLYILTARHVVRNSSGAASDLHVRFKAAPQTRFPATLLPQNDPDQDVAALVVEGLAAGGVDICRLFFGNLGSAALIKRGAAVIPIGNPGGESWAEPVKPDIVSAITGDQIVFQSVLIMPGHSGGGLLDDSGRLIGMIQSDQPPFGRALTMDKAVAILQSWNYPVDLYSEGGLPPLFQAIDQKDLAATRSLLGRACTDINARADLNAAAEDTALRHAARTGRKDLVELLLDAGAKVNGPGGHDATPLMAAAAQGSSMDIVRLLLDRGANVNANDGYNTPLMAASRTGRIEVVRFLLANGANPNLATRDGVTALHIATIGGEPEILRSLISAGADVNWKDKEGRTPLHRVMGSSESREMAKILLEAGADPSIRDKSGKSVLASIHDEQQLVFALQHASKIPPEDLTMLLYDASTQPWLQVLPLLFAHGVDIRGTEARERFLSAAEAHNLDVVRTMLECGADPNRSGRDSPVGAVIDSHYRLSDQGFEVLKLLVAKGADVNAGNPLRQVLYFVSNPDLRVLEFLVAHGAEVTPDDIAHAKNMTNQAVVDVLLKAKVRRGP